MEVGRERTGAHEGRGALNINPKEAKDKAHGH